MTKLNQAAAGARRAAARLLPAGRGWGAAIWTEAHVVPRGLERLAWRAGGVWVIAREALMPRRLGRAALFAAALGTGTTALMLRSTWLLHWLNHGHHLTAIAAYRYEADTSSNAAIYLFMLIWFPVIGLIMSALGAACIPLGRPAEGDLTPVPATSR